MYHFIVPLGRKCCDWWNGWTVNSQWSWHRQGWHWTWLVLYNETFIFCCLQIEKLEISSVIRDSMNGVQGWMSPHQSCRKCIGDFCHVVALCLNLWLLKQKKKKKKLTALPVFHETLNCCLAEYLKEFR